MSALAGVWSIARADFLERSRRYQYFATLVVTLAAGVFFVPPRGANYVAFTVDGYRGIYNSAWMGAMMAMLATTALSLFGFYLVKSAIEVDRQTRVGEIVASTSVRKLAYVTGKWLGSVAVLLSLGLVLVADAVIMQWVRGEDRSIGLAAIAFPFAVVLVPVAALVAAMAVGFEAVPVLRGGFGNVVYFFAWIFGLSASAQTDKKLPVWWTDPLGLVTVGRQVDAAVSKIAPHSAKDFSMVMGGGPGAERYFVWHGFEWTASDLAARALWVAVAFGIVALAASAFDRFASGARPASERAPKTWMLHAAESVERITAPVFDRVFAGDLGSLVLAELRLMLKGANFWWYAVALGLWIATLASPSAAQSALLGVIWLWPILIWSQMGTRESIDDTEGFVYPSLHPLRRQFLASWIAGIAVALLLGSGSLVHWIALGSYGGAAAVLAGAVFVPTLALACGAASGTSRLFEVVYLVLWYVGPMNGVKGVDFTAPSGTQAALAATAVLFAVAFTMRRLRLRRA
ncbi:MAG TPA: hypothetical protein VMF61_02750 [Candidatus Acidoferrales bacterium]|nr:hypothetical protein [Candidatus Acidoferrales bacterium]